MASKFGENLATLRKQYGYTREDFANELQMSVNTLRNYENGTREPGHKFVIDMARRFRVTTDYLLGVENSKKEDCDPNKKRILDDYERLNDLGRVAAADRVNELAQLPKYQKSNSYIAARGKGSLRPIELTEEERKERDEAPERDLDL